MASEKRQITRNRISYSCQRCRQRKVKCDKIHPVCSSCQKTDEQCIYSIGELDQEPQPATQAEYSVHGKKRRRSSVELHQEHTDGEDISPAGAGLESQLLQLNSLLSQFSAIAGIDSIEGSNVNSVTNIHCETVPLECPQQPCEDQASSLHRASRQSNSLIITEKDLLQQESPSLERISTRLEQLIDLLRKTQHNIRSDIPNIQILPPQSPHFANSDLSRPNGILFVPDERQRNVLFRSWLSSVYPVLPIVDPVQVLMRYRTFHFWYTYGLEKGIANPVEEFMPLIYAIYYAGTVSLSLKGFRKWYPAAHRQKVLRSLHAHFVETLKAPSEMLSNTLVHAARVMMSYMCAHEEWDTRVTDTASLLARSAYGLNLHRERPNDSLDGNIAELRRRLWWETVIVDTVEASASNTPPTMDQQFYDISMMSEIKDAKLGTSEAKNYGSKLAEGSSPDVADDPTMTGRSSMVSVINLVMKARTILACNARKVLTINLAAKPKTKEGMIEIRKNLEVMDHYVNSLISRIPSKGLPELNFSPTLSKAGHSLLSDHFNIYGDDLISIEVETVCGMYIQPERWELPYVVQYRQPMIGFHKWSRIYLSMMIDQLHCFSYAPYMHNRRRKLWVAARQCALKHAHSNIRKYNALAMDSEIEGFRWAWPSFCHPIHAAVIILLDAYEHPSSREAPRSRALMDEMLSLMAPEYGIIGGEDGLQSTNTLAGSGSEANAMLMQLRAKAWQKAGLDPTLLWTEKDQIDIGITTPLTEAEKVAQSIREDTILPPSTSLSQLQHSSAATLMRPIIERRSKEHFHPSYVATAEDLNSDPITPRACVNHLESVAATQAQPTQHFKRARPNQQRIPTTLTTQHINSNHKPGHTYKFRLPSELYDVGALIRKIKSFQHQQPPPPNNASAEDTSVHSTETSQQRQQPASTPTERSSILLTDQLPPHPQRAASPEANAEPAAKQANGTAAVVPDNPFVKPVQSTQVRSTAQTLGTNIGGTSGGGDGSGNDTAAQAQAQAQTSPPPDQDQLNMEFDWERWDEIFGHVLDDGFGGDAVYADTDVDVDVDVNADDAETI